MDDTTGSSVAIPGGDQRDRLVQRSFDQCLVSCRGKQSLHLGHAELGDAHSPIPVGRDVPITRYAKVVAADSPVAYWRLDELNADNGVATDAVGSFDGTYNDVSGSFLFGAASGNSARNQRGGRPASGGANIRIPYALGTQFRHGVVGRNLGATGFARRQRRRLSRRALPRNHNLFPNPYNGWVCLSAAGQ